MTDILEDSIVNYLVEYIGDSGDFEHGVFPVVNSLRDQETRTRMLNRIAEGLAPNHSGWFSTHIYYLLGDLQKVADYNRTHMEDSGKVAGYVKFCMEHNLDLDEDAIVRAIHTGKEKLAKMGTERYGPNKSIWYWNDYDFPEDSRKFWNAHG